MNWIKENIFGLSLLAPTIIILFAVSIFPMIYTVWISLYDFYLPRPHSKTFVGLGNYIEILKDEMFWLTMKNTAVFMSSTIFFQFTIGLLLALVFFEEFRGKSAKAIYLPLILLPMMVAPVVVGYIFRLLYLVQWGPLNYLLEFVNLGPYEWTASVSTSMISVILADVWQWTPFVTLVLLAGLVSLPSELFEVADMDGATLWQKLIFIILPLMTRVIAIILLIRMVDSLREMDKIYIMTQGGPGSSTELVTFWAYLSGFKYFKVGYAAAMSVILLIMTIIIATGLAKFLHREQN